MRDTERAAFAELLTATMEVYNANLTPASIGIWWSALARYSLPEVRGALSAHVTNPAAGKFSPKPADIIAAIQCNDGRPNADEAWSLTPQSEGDTVVWTDETAQAYFEAAHKLARDDRIAARMAFKGAYERLVTAARAVRKPLRWQISLGHDVHGRETALLEAAERGRITVNEANALITHNQPPSARLLGLLQQNMKRLTV